MSRCSRPPRRSRSPRPSRLPRLSRRSRLSRVLALPLAALAVGAAPAAAADAVDAPPGVRFYIAPKSLPGKGHGDLIWARKLTGAAVVPGAASTKVVLYRSMGVRGNAVPVSGVVSLPEGKAPKGGWPVITYAHGTTGIADQCAPSRDRAGTPVHPYNAYVFPLLTRWLKAGYAVVRTDYEGLGTTGVHPYLVGNSEGRSVLDMVRAARAAAPRGALSKDIIIAGHSQGGHAALFAAALAPKYTPELHLRGTVAFAPASHLDEQIPVTTVLTQPGGGLSALISLIVTGVGIANPSFNPQAILSPRAQDLSAQTVTQCLPELAATDVFGGLAPKDLFAADVDLKPAAKLLDVQDPSHLHIRTPLRIEQGSADGTVLPLFTDALARELKAGGATGITYKKYAGVDHGGIVSAAAKDATTWIAQRLR
jgi:pimeloyl-ACP methyl ester carboxylesterase